MEMHGDQFHVSAALIEAFHQHAPDGDTQRIHVAGEPFWRTGEGIDEDGESFFIYEQMPSIA